MLFNIEFDTGGTIEGYLVPDGFADKPRILVSDGGGVEAEFDCLEPRDAVRSSGRHETGLVGFRLDESALPGLAGMRELRISDAKTGLLIYRRGHNEWTQKRVVRLDAQFIPFVEIDKSVEELFQYGIGRVERFGLETTLQIFHLNATSVYLAGRLQIRSFEQFLEHGFDAVTILTEPYYEMAERLFFLKRFAELPEVMFGPRDRMILAPAADHLADVDLTSAKSLRGALRSMDPAIARVLRNPLTRQLTTVAPDEEPDRRSAAAGLDVISRFAVTGLRQYPETFTLPFSELLGVGPDSIAEPRQHRMIAQIASLLRDMPQAEAHLETDLVIYHFASQAILRHAGRSRASG